MAYAAGQAQANEVEVPAPERMGIEESSSAPGGHALPAARVVSRVREPFGVELPPRCSSWEHRAAGRAC